MCLVRCKVRDGSDATPTLQVSGSSYLVKNLKSKECIIFPQKNLMGDFLVSNKMNYQTLHSLNLCARTVIFLIAFISKHLNTEETDASQQRRRALVKGRSDGRVLIIAEKTEGTWRIWTEDLSWWNITGVGERQSTLFLHKETSFI